MATTSFSTAPHIQARDATLDDHDRSIPRTQRTYGGGVHNRRDGRSDYRHVGTEDPGIQQRDHVPANRYSRDSYGSLNVVMHVSLVSHVMYAISIIALMTKVVAVVSLIDEMQ